jgi:hypothetical protein
MESARTTFDEEQTLLAKVEELFFHLPPLDIWI